jgi:hypothetical protein
MRRRKPGSAGKVELGKALLEEWEETKASTWSLAGKYGVSNGTARRWIYKRIKTG